MSLRHNHQKYLGWIVSGLGVLSVLAALPRPVSSVLELGILKINLGTNLDLIRLIVGLAIIYIGYKGIKMQW